MRRSWWIPAMAPSPVTSDNWSRKLLDPRSITATRMRVARVGGRRDPARYAASVRSILLALGLALAGCSGGLATVAPALPASTTSVVPTTTVPPTTTTTVPPTTTTAVATTTTTTLPPKGTLVIHGVGDVNVDPSYIPVLATEGYDHAWSGVSDVFTTDALTVVNLECPVATVGSPADKAFTFRCDPDALDEMVEAGVDVTGQANNHVLDFGVDAMLESRELLTAAGLIPVGTGPDAEAAYAPHLIEVDGWTIAVLGFSGPRGSSTWPATDERPGMADARDPEAMNAAIAAADAIADLVVVTVTAGTPVNLSVGFMVTGALVVVSPGAGGSSDYRRPDPWPKGSTHRPARAYWRDS